MNTYTIPVQMHSFSAELAFQLKSVDLAILVQHFINMISNHKRMGRNSFGNKTWHECTRADIRESFPYYSEKQARNLTDKLVELKILKVGRFNKNTWDRTNWYAFFDEEKWGISNISYVGPNGQMDVPERANGSAQMGKCYTMSTVLDSVKKDNVRTMPQYKKKDRQPDPVKRWKLNEDQALTFKQLKDENVNSDDGTIAFWCKKYSAQRLIDVLNYSKLQKPDNLGAYMNNLLKKESAVENDTTRINKKTAESFKIENQWADLKIYEKHAMIVISTGAQLEICFLMDPIDFYVKLESFYQMSNY